VTAPAIEVRDLEVTVAGTTILEDISFSVSNGDSLSVIGPNGAGKSTLLKALDDLLEPDRGQVLINGTPLADMNRRELARTVSYVPQDDARHLPFSVGSFVHMGRYPHLRGWGALTAEDLAAVRSALEVTETTLLAERPISSLSGGERQRVLIAAALAQGGSILLLDEPTAFLDYRHQVQILDLLERLRASAGRTIVTVTHDLNNALAASSTVLALRQGRVAFHGPCAEVVSEERLADIYGTSFELVPCAERSLPLVLPRREP
jgi:iron complex transport system ATP-binding protein